MLPKLFFNDLYTNIANTLISVIILSIIYIVTYKILLHKNEAPKNRKRLKIRLFYGISFIFLFIVAKIWVEGFTYLITALSLVSAALVLSNKELVMNVVGSLIINWRDVFTEGDYIQIQNYSGYVYELGVLNFKIFEASPSSSSRTSGRSIKIPNGLVIYQPVINYSRQSNFIEYQQCWLLTYESDMEAAKTLFRSIAKSILKQMYKSNKEYSDEWLKRRSRILSRLMNFDVHVQTDIKLDDEPYGIQLKISYYCYPQDQDAVDTAIKEEIFKQLKTHPDIQLMLPVN